MEHRCFHTEVSEITVGAIIAIPESWSGALQQARKDSGDPLAATVPPHLTLLAPTTLASDQLETLAEHLAIVADSMAAFTIALHGVSSFLPISPVAFVPVIDGGKDLAALAAGIRSGPVPLPQQFPFHPHVTVAHRVEPDGMERVCRSLMTFDATVPVDRFTLSISNCPPTCPAASWMPWREFHLAKSFAHRV
ncbi:2'-5' RNA ligase family protein [Glycomyces luteolus]|uniref:2'-5' RNA ligase family protein n=1 Tax=Glycomyces luteolus TaxID=2670330 RepID=A0A9X3T3A0_9ACTN|nr:2'-5' RNA ligase family protein [Glycomyces luteolus]MDA1359755.1 2'-5' RNA ligase family protein [Glycomyces luteolus]